MSIGDEHDQRPVAASSPTRSALTLVPTPIGNLDDITVRSTKVLASVDGVIAEDTRMTGRLLMHLGIQRPLIPFHTHNEHRMVDQLVARMRAGERFALVSDAGTPGISDPGFLLTRAAVQAGLSVECLPGATAFVPALVNSALPSDRFVFEGFLPVKKGRRTRLEELSTEGRTMVFYESPHRLRRTLTDLMEAFGQGRLASISREISKLHEETMRGSLADLASHFERNEPRGEFVVVVSGVS